MGWPPLELWTDRSGFPPGTTQRPFPDWETLISRVQDCEFGERWIDDGSRMAWEWCITGGEGVGLQDVQCSKGWKEGRGRERKGREGKGREEKEERWSIGVIEEGRILSGVPSTLPLPNACVWMEEARGDVWGCGSSHM